MKKFSHQELRDIILKQQQYYEEALTKISDILKADGHPNYIDIIDNIKEHYGLLCANLNKRKLVDVFDVVDELIDVFKESKEWIPNLVLKSKVIARTSEHTYDKAVRILLEEGKITRHREGPVVSYKMNGGPSRI